MSGKGDKYGAGVGRKELLWGCEKEEEKTERRRQFLGVKLEARLMPPGGTET